MQLISTIFYQGIGAVEPPAALSRLGDVTTGPGTLLNIIFNILIIAGGIYTLFNFILAGYSFLSAGDDPKKVESAWKKIYMSIIGLVFIAGAFVIGAIVSYLLYADVNVILNPTIPTL